MSNTLTISDVIALQEIVSSAYESAKVAWTGISGDVLYGTARHIVKDDSFNFVGNEQDVRDSFLRITSNTGFEYCVPVRELMEKQKNGGFAKYDW